MSPRGVNLSSQAKARVSEDPSSMIWHCGSPVSHWAAVVASVGTSSSGMMRGHHGTEHPRPDDWERLLLEQAGGGGRRAS